MTFHLTSADAAAWLAALAALAAVASALAAAFAAIVASRALRSQRQTQGTAGLFDIVARQYLDREFLSTEPPTINGVLVTKTRPLKATARQALATSEAEWTTEVVKFGTWQNRLAFEVSIALERLGVAAFSGSLSLRLLLPLAADQILEDWTYCAPWVARYRTVQRTYQGSVPFHRRYAEWLVLVAAVWMQRHYPNYTPLKEVHHLFGGHQAIEKRLVDQSAQEADTLDPHARHELRLLLGMRL